MIIYIDMDDVLCDYTGAYNCAINTVPEIGYPQSQYGFYAGLAVIEGAIEALQKFATSNQYDPYILTAPSTNNPLCYTEKRVWVEKFCGPEFIEKLIISPNKGLLKGDYLIDDNIHGRGQESFDGMLIHFGSVTYPDWQSIINFFFKK